MGRFTVNIAGCLPCCGGSNCVLTLPDTPLGDGGNFPSLAAAESWMDGLSRPFCLGEQAAGSSNFTANIVGVVLSLRDHITGSSVVLPQGFMFRASLIAAGGLALDYNVVYNRSGIASITLTTFYANYGVASTSSYTANAVSHLGRIYSNVASDDCYYVYASCKANTSSPDPTDSVFTLNISSANVWTVGSVQAAYDDGLGGTAYVPC